MPQSSSYRCPEPRSLGYVLHYPAQLRPEKYSESGRLSFRQLILGPGLLPHSSAYLTGLLHCHTIALYTGLPPCLSPGQRCLRWLVTATACINPLAAERVFRHELAYERPHLQAAHSGHAPPSRRRGCICRCFHYSACPLSSVTGYEERFVPVVLWSIAIMYFSVISIRSFVRAHCGKPRLCPRRPVHKWDFISPGEPQSSTSVGSATQRTGTGCSCRGELCHGRAQAAVYAVLFRRHYRTGLPRRFMTLPTSMGSRGKHVQNPRAHALLLQHFRRVERQRPQARRPLLSKTSPPWRLQLSPAYPKARSRHR